MDLQILEQITYQYATNASQFFSLFTFYFLPVVWNYFFKIINCFATRSIPNVSFVLIFLLISGGFGQAFRQAKLTKTTPFSENKKNFLFAKRTRLEKNWLPDKNLTELAFTWTR